MIQSQGFFFHFRRTRMPEKVKDNKRIQEQGTLAHAITVAIQKEHTIV